MEGLQLEGRRVLRIRQVKEWGEILTGFETRNRYQVLDERDQVVLFAGEVESGALQLIARLFLKAKRPFTMELRTHDNRLALTLKRPWRWLFSRMEVLGAAGQHLGSIQQRFKLFGRLYDVLSPTGELWARLEGPLFQPWTFWVRRAGGAAGSPVGRIVKRWSGLGKELFTAADNFGVELQPELRGEGLRTLVLAATFLIDFVHFERRD